MRGKETRHSHKLWRVKERNRLSWLRGDEPNGPRYVVIGFLIYVAVSLWLLLG